MRKSIRLKIVFALTLCIGLIHLYGQGESNIKVSVKTGILIRTGDYENISILLNVEPKVKVLDNTYFGLRIGVALNSYRFVNLDNTQYTFDEFSDNGALSFIPTLDYYLNAGNLRTYIGCGIGLNILPDPIDIIPSGGNSIIESTVAKRIGFLLRTGIEIRKLRIGLEYNYVLKGDLVIPDNQIIGSLSNNYFALTAGHLFGG